MTEDREFDARDVGIGYTLASGNLFCHFAEFHAFAERLVGRALWTHEFADRALWAELRQAFEEQVTM